MRSVGRFAHEWYHSCNGALRHRIDVPTLGPVDWGIIVIAAAAGLMSGLTGRLVLARLRRGVVLHAGPCELAGAALFAVVVARWHSGALPGWWLPVPVALSVFAVPLVAVDIARRRLPDALTYSTSAALGCSVLAVAGFAGNEALVLAALSGSVVFFTMHLLVHVVAPLSLGGGDVKLAGGLGGVLGAVGWPALVIGAGLASLITLAMAAFGRLARVGEWRSGVPHGPGLLAATWLVVVFPGTGLGVGSLA